MFDQSGNKRKGVKKEELTCSAKCNKSLCMTFDQVTDVFASCPGLKSSNDRVKEIVRGDRGQIPLKTG